ncbi:MAG: DUF4303 domain-containing protein [Lachnospiraceae bacterium]|nr:DUF4303 domain-containing protein [Lachnospiraceae bacterium]
MAQQKIKMSPFLLGAITNSLGRLPCTPYDLTKVKKLIDFYPVNFWTDEIPDMVIEGAGNFSCIGKMPNLHTLIFSNSICTTFFINNFSFLADCQKVKILDMTNTNFSDCRLLLSMPCLHKVLLPTEEQLIHTEVLDTLVNHNVQVFLMDPQAHKAAADIRDIRDVENLLQLKKALYTAIKSILMDLYQNQEHYYYITLVSDGDAHTPCISAWSYEALARSASSEEEKALIKWSYADSPYCCHRQEEFAEVDRLLQERSDICTWKGVPFDIEYENRYMLMEEIMQQLDKEGLFAINQARKEVVVLVEVMPPEEENTLRAYRMNRKNLKIFRKWLEEAAEYSINIKYWNHGFGMQDDSFVLLKYLADKGKAAISVTELFSDLGLDKMQGDFKQTRDLLKKTNIKYAINIITDLAALLLECKINQTVNLNKLAWRNIKSAVSEICITATPEEHALINKTLMDFASEPSAYDLSEVYNKNYLQKFALLCKELRKELYNKR